MPIKYTRPIIVDYEYYTNLYPIADGDKTRQRGNIEKWILTSQDYINSICGGLPYKVFALWLEKDASGIITEEEKIRATALQVAICQYVEICIQTGHFFVDMNGAVQGAQSFNINASSENANVEKTRQDIIRLLVQSGLYQTLSYGEEENKSTPQEYDLKNLVNVLSTYFIKVDGNNKITPDSNFDFAGSSFQVTGNISGAKGDIKKELSNFKLVNCEGIDTEISFKDIKGDPRENVELFNEFDTLEGAIMETDVQLEAVKTQLTNKADTTYVNTELAKKTDTTYVNTELSKKADKTELTTLETKVDANTTSITNLQNTKADKTELNDYVRESQVIIESFSKLNASTNLGQGNLKYFTEADGGNPWIETSSYRPIRTGQIIVSNKYNGTSLTQPGNRWYVSGGLIANIPEVNDNRKVIKFPMDQNMPSYVVANNVDAIGYSIRFDSATHSNVDTQIIFGIGASNQKKEGYMTCPIRGYYVRNNNTYQLVQFNLYFQFGELDGREYFELWGSCMGRDRNAYFNLPTDVASTGYAPQNYVLNYRVYNKEQI